ncbi:MAG: hypothetical protein LBC98_04260, partial [Prevotellaceae bacterium]|nr:hypothetical protein [Prevotellaceae bacterium]
VFKKEEISQLFPEYYVILVKHFDSVAKDSLDEWIYYLKHNEIPDNFKARGLEQAREKLRIDRLPESERVDYLRHLDNVSFAESLMDSSKRDGIIEGVGIGKKEGIEIGKKDKSRQVIISGYTRGLPPEMLGILTDLSEDEVLEILREEKFNI